MSTSPADKKHGHVMTRRSSPHSSSPDSVGGKDVQAEKESPNLAASTKVVSDETEDSPIDRTETETTRGGESTAPVQARSNARWYQKINPLRLRSIPPVPTERQVSKEYGAGFFSIVTFQWMSSMMTVSSRFFLYLPL